MTDARVRQPDMTDPRYEATPGGRAGALGAPAGDGRAGDVPDGHAPATHAPGSPSLRRHAEPRPTATSRTS